MMRTNPFEDVERMFERMNRRMGDGFDRMGDGFDAVGGWSEVRVDVADDEDSLVVTADVPGFEKADIDVSVAEGVLTIRAERESDDSTADETFVRRERHTASVRRSVSLPVEVDADGAEATYVNGVLTVRLPKVAVDADEGHHIDVK